MRVKKSVSKNSVSYSIIKDVIVKGKRTTKIVERLGNAEEIKLKHPEFEDPYDWAKEYAKKLNEKEMEGHTQIISKYNRTELIEKDNKNICNIGYMFLEKICSRLEIDKICGEIQKKYKISFSLSEMLRMLIYTRILYPSSKKHSYEEAKNFLEEPSFDVHQIYRGLSILANESDYLEKTFYKSSLNLVKRNTKILYYDCTNFFFEIEEEDGIKKYGKSKEHRPNPIVQMGLFMDGSGIPLAFTIFDGNKNEQPTLREIEKKILKDFELSKFVVCTDAGLSSKANRRFNDVSRRAFITTRSVKKLDAKLKEWALSRDGWRLQGSDKVYNLDEIDDYQDIDKVFYKERWVTEDNKKKSKGTKVLEEKLIISYSPKYKIYQEEIRERQIQRALKRIENTGTLKYRNPNDSKRFIGEIHLTKQGELADKTSYSLNEDLISEEKKYDGLYLVSTNLEGDARTIIEINKKRWEIEETFRIMKTEFKARPVYLQRDDRIKAHFLTCFLSLLVYRILEKKLGDFTTRDIISTLKKMSWLKQNGEGYTPAYIRTELTDKLHETLGFRTDYQLFDKKMEKDLKKFLKNPKK